jgi:hypothetical protein
MPYVAYSVESFQKEEIKMFARQKNKIIPKLKSLYIRLYQIFSLFNAQSIARAFKTLVI